MRVVAEMLYLTIFRYSMDLQMNIRWKHAMNYVQKNQIVMVFYLENLENQMKVIVKHVELAVRMIITQLGSTTQLTTANIVR